MIPEDLLDPDLSDALGALRKREEPFAIATIIRTAGPTAAKPGTKALLRADGTILHGWLGGGCTRGAVTRATLLAIAQGRPQLISVTPEDDLKEKGVSAGDEIEGVRFARNGCPSEGSIEIFVEPCLPQPELVILGASPVAQALAELAPRFDWEVTALPKAERLAAAAAGRRRMIVIATQGQGDITALKAALAGPSDHIAFVGSRKKFAALSTKLSESGTDPDRLAAISAPAGVAIGAVTPEEIALSILAELTGVRRRDRDNETATMNTGRP
jgi:xanthine dehydrogenase accessory factor